jgi:hypothetical protein
MQSIHIRRYLSNRGSLFSKVKGVPGGYDPDEAEGRFHLGEDYIRGMLHKTDCIGREEFAWANLSSNS